MLMAHTPAHLHYISTVTMDIHFYITFATIADFYRTNFFLTLIFV
jgi:hypothetical protein